MEQETLRLIRTMLTENNIPYHCQQDILYKHKGFSHPTADTITQYWDYMREEQNAFDNINVFSSSYTDDKGRRKYCLSHNTSESEYPILLFPIVFKCNL